MLGSTERGIHPLHTDMAIQQTKKQSDLEKRLRLLHQQVYGKERVSREKTVPAITHNTSYLIPNTDITYLRQDLLKIFILAGSALGLQIMLFILSKNHILNLNFF